MFKPGDFILSSYCFAMKDNWHICYILSKPKTTFDFTLETISFFSKNHFNEYKYGLENMTLWGSHVNCAKEINFTDPDFLNCMKNHTFIHPKYEEEFKEFLRNKLYTEFGRPPDLGSVVSSEALTTNENIVADSISQEHLLNIVKPKVRQVDTTVAIPDRSVSWVNLKTLS